MGQNSCAVLGKFSIQKRQMHIQVRLQPVRTDGETYSWRLYLAVSNSLLPIKNKKLFSDFLHRKFIQSKSMFFVQQLKMPSQNRRFSNLDLLRKELSPQELLRRTELQLLALQYSHCPENWEKHFSKLLPRQICRKETPKDTLKSFWTAQIGRSADLPAHLIGRIFSVLFWKLTSNQ